MNRLSTKDRSSAIACLVEGNSQHATCRMTGLAKKTVSRLAVELGEACERFADNIMRDLPCEQIQCDEIWSFCYAKAKNVPKHLKGSGAGDVWTWVAIDPETKLIPAWYVGDRTAQSAIARNTRTVSSLECHSFSYRSRYGHTSGNVHSSLLRAGCIAWLKTRGEQLF